jgi:hypothetical protein
MPIMNSLELQKLVDGELPAAEQSALLNRLDRDPTSWRSVALALLEDQAFQREIRFFSKSSDSISESVLMTPPLAHSYGRRVGGEGHGDIFPVPLSPSTDVRIVSSSTRARRSLPNHWGRFALAASLLLAVGFGVGYGSRREFFDGSNAQSNLVASDSSSANVAIPSSPSSLETNAMLVSDPPRPIGELKFPIGEAGPNEKQFADIPLFEVRAEHVQQAMQQQLQQIEAWNRNLQRQGYRIEWQPEMFESRLPDGRALIVPVNQWNVRSVGH